MTITLKDVATASRNSAFISDPVFSLLVRLYKENKFMREQLAMKDEEGR